MKVRPCGGCTACCSVLGVHDIAKQPWTACEHLEEGGCGIYDARPNPCRKFNCLWQGWVGKESDRPDKIGVIFAPTNGQTEFTGEEEFQAYELAPGKFNTPEALNIARILTTATGKLLVGHVHGGTGYVFMGPDRKIAAAQKWMDKVDKGDVIGV